LTTGKPSIPSIPVQRPAIWLPFPCSSNPESTRLQTSYSAQLNVLALGASVPPYAEGGRMAGLRRARAPIVRARARR
jgi:hypothetical protein